MLAEMLATASNLLDKHPDGTLARAVFSLVKSFKKIEKNPVKVATAFHLFNKDSTQSHRSKELSFLAKRRGQTIKLTPRKRKMWNRFAGPRNVRTPFEHAYAKPLKRLRTRAPHKLQMSVESDKQHPN